MAKDKASDLTDKQLLFCQEYLKDLNGTQAAIRSGYSGKTARSQADRLLTNVDIQKIIQELKNKRSDRIEITSDMVLAELVKMGFSDIGEYLNDDYTLKPLDEIKDKSKAIQSIQREETHGETWSNVTVKFKLHDKLAALEKIAKHIGFFEKDNEQQNKILTPMPLNIYNTAPPLAGKESDVTD